MAKIPLARIIAAAQSLAETQQPITICAIARRINATNSEVAHLFRSIPWLRERVPLVRRGNIAREKYAAPAELLMRANVRCTARRIAALAQCSERAVSQFILRYPAFATQYRIVLHSVHKHRMQMARADWFLRVHTDTGPTKTSMAKVMQMGLASLWRWLARHPDIAARFQALSRPRP